MTDWKQVTTSEPCEVCGKESWCQKNGSAIQCMRHNQHPTLGEGRESEDSQGNTYWMWSTISADQENWDGPTIEPSTTRGDDETLNRVYRAFLKESTLLLKHVQALNHRGLSLEQVNELRRRGYGSQRDKGRAGTVRKMIRSGIPESDIAKTPGFYIVEHESSRYWTTSRLEGLVIPVRNADGLIVSLKVRLDDPGKGGKYRAFSSSSKKQKGSSPGSPVHFPIFDGGTSTVRITEGQLKADVATITTGILTIGLHSAGSWKSAAEAALAVNAKTVLVSYDADYRTNRQVRASMVKLVQSLKENGFEVRVESWK